MTFFSFFLWNFCAGFCCGRQTLSESPGWTLKKKEQENSRRYKSAKKKEDDPPNERRTRSPRCYWLEPKSGLYQVVGGPWWSRLMRFTEFYRVFLVCSKKGSFGKVYRVCRSWPNRFPVISDARVIFFNYGCPIWAIYRVLPSFTENLVSSFAFTEFLPSFYLFEKDPLVRFTEFVQVGRIDFQLSAVVVALFGRFTEFYRDSWLLRTCQTEGTLGPAGTEHKKTIKNEGIMWKKERKKQKTSSP